MKKTLHQHIVHWVSFLFALGAIKFATGQGLIKWEGPIDIVYLVGAAVFAGVPLGCVTALCDLAWARWRQRQGQTQL